jgi:methionine salvage enolase-phosphatase E1
MGLRNAVVGEEVLALQDLMEELERAAGVGVAVSLDY